VIKEFFDRRNGFGGEDEMLKKLEKVSASFLWAEFTKRKEEDF
jgi:hypothetical protein